MLETADFRPFAFLRRGRPADMGRTVNILRLLRRFQDVPGLTAVFRLYEWVKSVGPESRARAAPVAVPDGALPLPPPRLMMLVAGTPDASVFLYLGQRGLESIRDLLQRNGVALASLADVLDFGCGCGRVLRWWHGIPGVRVHGTDYNEEAIAWCRANLPFARFATNALQPPAPYADASFDLAYALSVVTHLPEPEQRAWLAEFRRILRPGGLLAFSTHGEHYLDRLAEDERRAFLAGEAVTRFSRSAGTNLCNTYHPVAAIRALAGEAFEVVDHVPCGALGNPQQDLWLLRRR